MRTSEILKLLVATVICVVCILLFVALPQQFFVKLKSAETRALFKESGRIATELNSRLVSMQLDSNMYARVAYDRKVEVLALHGSLEVETILRQLMQNISSTYPIELSCDSKLLGGTNNPICGLTNMVFVAGPPYVRSTPVRRVITIAVYENK